MKCKIRIICSERVCPLKDAPIITDCCEPLVSAADCQLYGQLQNHPFLQLPTLEEKIMQCLSVK